VNRNVKYCLYHGEQRKTIKSCMKIEISDIKNDDKIQEEELIE
jgi:hypothetical protein